MLHPSMRIATALTLLMSLPLLGCSKPSGATAVSDPIEGPVDKAAFAKATAGTWRSKGSYQSEPNPDGSRDTNEWDEVYVFTHAPTKTVHGTYKWTEKRTKNGRGDTNSDTGTWVVLSEPEQSPSGAWVAVVKRKSNKPGLDLSSAGPELRRQLERAGETKVELTKSKLVMYDLGTNLEFETTFSAMLTREAP